MKVFVPHYSKLLERKESILSQFAKHGIQEYEFVELFDKDSLTSEEGDRFHNIKKGEISIFLKHVHIFQQIAEHHEQALILEDDAILSDQFVAKLAKYMGQVPADFDMVFLGDGCNLHIEKHRIRPNVYIYEKCLTPTRWGGGGATRCTDSYIVSQKCARRLSTYINNQTRIDKAIDWFLNAAARENMFRVYWAEPTIVTQGVCFRSSLQGANT